MEATKSGLAPRMHQSLSAFSFISPDYLFRFANLNLVLSIIYSFISHLILNFNVEKHEISSPIAGLLAEGVKTVVDMQLHANKISVDAPITQKEEDDFLKRHPSVYFNIPVVKFWTSTIFYVAFLIFQAYPFFL